MTARACMTQTFIDNLQDDDDDDDDMVSMNVAFYNLMNPGYRWTSISLIIILLHCCSIRKFSKVAIKIVDIEILNQCFHHHVQFQRFNIL